MELIVTIVVFLLLLLLVIWLPFLKQNSIKAQALLTEPNYRDETNVQLYYEHKKEIEQDFQQGSIDEENYQYLIEELDKSLLQDIEENKHAAQEFDVNTHQFSIVWPSLITVFVLSFSFYTYNQTGAFEALSQPAQVPVNEAHNQVNENQQAVAKVQQLKALTVSEPENGDAWYSLGQGFVGIGDFDGAISAFDQVIRIEGEKADIYGAKAQALYYKNEQKITAQVQVFIDKALALDPNDPSTNIMLGMHNFMAQQYQLAIDYWQKVVNLSGKQVNVSVLKEAIAEAKNRLSLTGAPSTSIADDVVKGPQLTVEVSLSEAIIEQLSQGEDKVVFIYATPTDGTRMPVAAIKMKASDLPTTIVLDDSRAMTPQVKLSNVDQVHLYAIISNGGGVGIKSGDFKAEKLNVAVSSQGVQVLLIDSVVP